MKRIKSFIEKLNTPRVKRTAYMLIALVIVMWFVYRFVVIGIVARTPVFNATRVAAVNGVPVNVIVATRENGVLRIPVAVRNNTAYVTHDTAVALKPGMKIGNGAITSVSSNIDLDSGMYIVRTRGVADGLHFAEYRGSGYFVPVYAVRGGAVMVVRDGRAHAVPVTVARDDADNALVMAGLRDGDEIILGNVADNTKVQVSKGE